MSVRFLPPRAVHPDISLANEAAGSLTGEPATADPGRRQAPLPGQVNGTSGHTWHHRATLRRVPYEAVDPAVGRP